MQLVTAAITMLTPWTTCPSVAQMRQAMKPPTQRPRRTVANVGACETCLAKALHGASVLVHKRGRKVSLQELTDALCNTDMGPRLSG